MSVFRDLNRAAIDADLGKNAFKVFNTLLEQTLGYGKSTDRLTDRRLSSLSQVRLDRFRPALQDVLDNGLFEQRPAKKFQYRYTIAKTFLEKNGDKDFFTPALPKNRADSQKTEAISEKQRHTSLDLDPSLSSLLQPLQTLLSFSTEMIQQQMQQQAQFINTLLQAQQNKPISASAAASPMAAGFSADQSLSPSLTTVVNIPMTSHAFHSTVNISTTDINICESQLGNADCHISIPSEAVLKSVRKSDLKQNVQEQGESVGVGDDKSNQQQSVPAESCADMKTEQQPISGDNDVLPLPETMAKKMPSADYPESQSLLAQLSTQRQKQVFVVYSEVEEREGVHFPIGLLRTLVNKAKHNALILPKSFTEANTPLHPSMIIESSADRLARQDAEDAEDEQKLRKMLRDQSESTGISVQELAHDMRLTYLLPV